MMQREKINHREVKKEEKAAVREIQGNMGNQRNY